MTQTGDHGGESDDETNAALFAYNHVCKFKGLWRKTDEHKQQKADENQNHNLLCEGGLVQQVSYSLK